MRKPFSVVGAQGVCLVTEDKDREVGESKPHPGDALYGMLVCLTWKVQGATAEGF